ncbi:MAG TPA: hypothetical protein VJW94_10060 [Candidatus Acidoferrum sp.]|nr:hypothetical protein [Candidatus Acidoferrum sp.]
MSDPIEILEIVRDPRVDREFHTPTALVNWFLLKRSLSALSFAGKRFPTMLPKASGAGASERDNLWKRLQEKIPTIRQGPAELDSLAKWVSGAGSDDEPGILVQQILGSLFSDQFLATPESWQAAKVLVAAPRLSNLPKLFWWTVSGKVRRAKRLLAGMVAGDLAGVNAIGIAVHNVLKGLEHMRRLCLNESVRSALSSETAANQCLFAPISVYRQATSAGSSSGCPFSRGSLFVLNIGVASKSENGRRLVFLEDSWSRCPAAEWVPAMLEGVWRRALSFGNVRTGT